MLTPWVWWFVALLAFLLLPAVLRRVTGRHRRPAADPVATSGAASGRRVTDPARRQRTPAPGTEPIRPAPEARRRAIEADVWVRTPRGSEVSVSILGHPDPPSGAPAGEACGGDEGPGPVPTARTVIATLTMGGRTTTVDAPLPDDAAGDAKLAASVAARLRLADAEKEHRA